MFLVTVLAKSDFISTCLHVLIKIVFSELEFMIKVTYVLQIGPLFKIKCEFSLHLCELISF